VTDVPAGRTEERAAPLRIAVIGGGGAGLAAAWLLEERHDVVLYEALDRLGGHAHTVDVEVGGVPYAVDAGFQFFGAGRTYETFNRLLDAVGITRRAYPATMTLHRTHRGDAVVLPPFRGGKPVWGSLSPSALSDLLRFRSVLAGVPAFLARRDTTVTTAEYVEALGLPRSFVDGFLLPLLLGFWCVEPEELLGFAAYNTFFYLGDVLADGFHPPLQSQIEGGMRAYVDAVRRDLRTTEVRLSAAVAEVARDADGYVVTDAAGRRDRFDRLVIAAGARQAAGLLQGIPELDAMTSQLRRFEYFDTTIAIHGDARLMPPRRDQWSVVNARWDGVHTQVTAWDAGRGIPLFKSWVTFEERMPERLHATATYEHGKVTVDYYDAQRRLAAMRGDRGVWLAGLYTDDADSHESAVHSAVAVAQELAPGTGRLTRLGG
jgi:uncharacterized protein